MDIAMTIGMIMMLKKDLEPFFRYWAKNQGYQETMKTFVFLEQLRLLLVFICAVNSIQNWLFYVSSSSTGKTKPITIMRSIVLKTSLRTFSITVPIMKVSFCAIGDIQALDTILGRVAKLTELRAFADKDQQFLDSNELIQSCQLALKCNGQIPGFMEKFFSRYNISQRCRSWILGCIIMILAVIDPIVERDSLGGRSEYKKSQADGVMGWKGEVLVDFVIFLIPAAFPVQNSIS